MSIHNSKEKKKRSSLLTPTSEGGDRTTPKKKKKRVSISSSPDSARKVSKILEPPTFDLPRDFADNNDNDRYELWTVRLPDEVAIEDLDGCTVSLDDDDEHNRNIISFASPSSTPSPQQQGNNNKKYDVKVGEIFSIDFKFNAIPDPVSYDILSESGASRKDMFDMKYEPLVGKPFHWRLTVSQTDVQISHTGTYHVQISNGIKQDLKYYFILNVTSELI